jgi:hypothetical protein
LSGWLRKIVRNSWCRPGVRGARGNRPPPMGDSNYTSKAARSAGRDPGCAWCVGWGARRSFALAVRRQRSAHAPSAVQPGMTAAPVDSGRYRRGAHSTHDCPLASSPSKNSIRLRHSIPIEAYAASTWC